MIVLVLLSLFITLIGISASLVGEEFAHREQGWDGFVETIIVFVILPMSWFILVGPILMTIVFFKVTNLVNTHISNYFTIPYYLIPDVILGLLIYFIPFLICIIRKYHDRLAILFLNILVGWTILGWIIAIVWSGTAVKKNT